jgi:uncharacterized OB-fold protein
MTKHFTSPTLKSARTLCLTYDIPISKTQEFWDGLIAGKILATKCRKCKILHFPPVAECGSCLSQDVEWIELSGEGTVDTFTHVVVRPTSFRDERPYTLAIAGLKEGVRVLTWLIETQKKDVQVGMKVRLVARLVDDRYIYALVPV